jgi:hypothetical protein
MIAALPCVCWLASAARPRRLRYPIKNSCKPGGKPLYLSAAPGPIRWHYRQKINALVYQAIIE